MIHLFNLREIDRPIFPNMVTVCFYCSVMQCIGEIQFAEDGYEDIIRSSYVPEKQT